MSAVSPDSTMSIKWSSGKIEILVSGQENTASPKKQNPFISKVIESLDSVEIPPAFHPKYSEIFCCALGDFFNTFATLFKGEYENSIFMASNFFANPHAEIRRIAPDYWRVKLYLMSTHFRCEGDGYIRITLPFEMSNEQKLELIYMYMDNESSSLKENLEKFPNPNPDNFSIENNNGKISIKMHGKPVMHL